MNTNLTQCPTYCSHSFWIRLEYACLPNDIVEQSLKGTSEALITDINAEPDLKLIIAIYEEIG